MSTGEERGREDAAQRRDQPDPGERGAHNEIGFRNVDEDAEHDEVAGEQGPSTPSTPPATGRPRD
jgi:hypothetical protein